MSSPTKNGTPVMVPPDGGIRAWSIMIASFLCNGVIFGLINSYSVIYVELQKRLNASGASDSSSKAGKFFKNIKYYISKIIEVYLLYI